MDIKEIDWIAYKEGQQACKEVDHDATKAKNPYKSGSKKFKSWNRGWNSVPV